MNRSKIIELLKELQKDLCYHCPARDQDECKPCKIFIIPNKVIEELNGT
jgi:hypothetical protein